jgi:hypothetical protein
MIEVVWLGMMMIVPKWRGSGELLGDMKRFGDVVGRLLKGMEIWVLQMDGVTKENIPCVDVHYFTFVEYSCRL